MNLLTMPNQKTMSSREIAELCDKEHRNVMRDIRRMLDELFPNGSAQIGADPLAANYRDEQNGQTYPEYRLPKRETLILVSGYSVAMRAKIIDRWQELEHAQSQYVIPETFSDALLLAGKLQAEVEATHAALAIAQPKAAALDRIATATDGAVCLRVAAKLLQMPERKFLQFARAKGFIFRSNPGCPWQGYADKAKAGLLELKITTVLRFDGTEKRVEQVLVTPAGVAKLAELLERAA